MANRLLKLYSFLLYLLALATSFFVGITFAKIVEAGKDQGLAGGAIVFGYGVIASVIGLIISLFVAHKINRKTIIRLNIILALCLAGFYAYYQIRYLNRLKARELETQKTELPKQPSSFATNVIYKITFN